MGWRPPPCATIMNSPRRTTSSARDHIPPVAQVDGRGRAPEESVDVVPLSSLAAAEGAVREAQLFATCLTAEFEIARGRFARSHRDGADRDLADLEPEIVADLQEAALNFRLWCALALELISPATAQTVADFASTLRSAHGSDGTD